MFLDISKKSLVDRVVTALVADPTEKLTTAPMMSQPSAGTERTCEPDDEEMSDLSEDEPTDVEDEPAEPATQETLEPNVGVYSKRLSETKKPMGREQQKLLKFLPASPASRLLPSAKLILANQQKRQKLVNTKNLVTSCKKITMPLSMPALPVETKKHAQKTLLCRKPLSKPKGATTGGAESNAKNLKTETNICLEEVLNFIQTVKGKDLLKVFKSVNLQRRLQTNRFKKGERVCYFSQRLNKTVFGEVQEVLNKRLEIKTDDPLPMKMRNAESWGTKWFVDSANVKKEEEEEEEEDKPLPSKEKNFNKKRLSKKEKDNQAAFKASTEKVKLKKMLDRLTVGDRVEWTNTKGFLETGTVMGKSSERWATVFVSSQKCEYPILASLLVHVNKT